jgi:D-psicose/D-tagatose/L-ribulose 3-epimerase
MMKYAIHSLLWSERFDIEPERVIKKAKAFGFDGIEIYVSPAQIDTFNKQRVRNALRDAGLECIGCTCLDIETDVTSQNGATRKRGIKHLEKAAELFSELDGNLVTGVTYAAWGKLTGTGRTDEEWNRSVESLREACRLVRKCGVTFGVEPANRFETYFLNTAADAIKLVKEVGEPNVGVHLDTFHMNIEEKNYYDPIVASGKVLCHMHCCENDRGVAGTGNVDWDSVFRALSKIKYDRWITLESFTPEIRSVAASTAIWRQIAPSADAIASEGLKFLKSMQRKRFKKGKD